MQKTKRSASQKRKSVLSVLLIVAILVAGAFAFLTAQDSKTNVFTVGNVNAELWEHCDTNGNDYLDDSETYDASTDTVVYTNPIVPGQEILKQPFVKNTGKNDAWIYLTVAIPTASASQIYKQDDGSINLTGTTRININCYAIQDGYKDKNNSQDIWNAYFDTAKFGEEETDEALMQSDRVQLFRTNFYQSDNENTFYDTENWTQIGNCYHAKAESDGVAYNYYTYGYKTKLAPGDNSFTTPLFASVTFNADIGEAGPITLNYYSEDNILLAVEMYEPNDIVEEPYFEDSLVKPCFTFDWVDMETGESLCAGDIILEDKDVQAKYTGFFTDESGEVPDEAIILDASDYLTYKIEYNDKYGLFASVFTLSTDICDYNKIEEIPEAPFTTVIPNEITINQTVYDKRIQTGPANTIYSYFGAAYDKSQGVLSDMLNEANTQEIKVPVKVITDNNRFKDASSVYIPDSVEEIYDMNRMPNLEEVNIPYACRILGDNLNGQYDDTEDMGVTTGFEHCDKLRRIVLPNSLLEIGQNSFLYCTSLEEISLPNSLKFIGQRAFANCGNLTTVHFGTGLETICTGAFSGCPITADVLDLSNCTNLTSIGYSFINPGGMVQTLSDYKIKNLILPDSFSTITGDANSSSIASAGNIVYHGSLLEEYPQSKFGASILNGWIDKTENGYIGYSDEAKTSIHTADVQGSVVIPAGVTSIEEAAFSTCKDLTSITLPKSIANIEHAAFGYCSNLSEIIIPDNANLKILGDYAFCESNITSIKIPKGITSIGYRAFSNCKQLTNVTIPDGVTTIDDYAFMNCSSLTNITLPDSVTNIGQYAFYGCTSLTDIIVPGNTYYFAFANCTNLRNVTICDGVTSIGQSTFAGCKNLTSIDLPDSVAYLGSSAFSDCTNLERVALGNGLTQILSGTFSGCSKLTNVTLPNGLTEIYTAAFMNCTNLRNITIPDSVYRIIDTAFKNCNNLTITISQSTYNTVMSRSSGLQSGYFKGTLNIV